MKHNKFEYVKKVVETGIHVLLTGAAGTGKTTIAKQVAEAMGVPFYALSLTKQTSVNAIIGFMNVQSVYTPTQFRQAFEHGGVFLLDELDAGDANVLLTLNTIENGYVAFPDKIVQMHENFRLIATANPQDQHNIYTGRSKLDFSTMDRFFEVELERDPGLEASLTDEDTVASVELARRILRDNGSSRAVTMRDAIRVYQLRKHHLDDSPVKSVVFKGDATLLKIYENEVEKYEKELAEARRKANMTQADARDIHELFNLVQEGK